MRAERHRPVYYSPRSQMRQREFPDLFSATRPPSLASTTLTEVSDEAVGLVTDPVAQRRAEDFVTATLAFRARQAERALQVWSAIDDRPAPRFLPTRTHIAVAADDDEAADDVPVTDVVEAMTPVRSRFDG